MTKYLEYDLQVSICQYINMQYPDVMYLSDAISNIKLTATQQGRNKKIQAKDFACPDLCIFAPSGKYHGLFMELKKETPFKVDGTLKAQGVKLKKGNVVVGTYDHLKEQDRALRRLRNLGYKAEFVWSLPMAIRLMKEYFENI